MNTMQDHYEINVAKEDGKRGYYIGSEFHKVYVHFCKVIVEQIYPECETHEVYKTMKEKFPESEGYKVDVTLWQGRGQHLTEAWDKE